MRKEKFFALVMTAALMLGLAGCQGSIEAEAADTEKAANESRETVTAAGQSENEAAETVVQKVDISDFAYPDDPLTTENLIKITTAAKEELGEKGETNLYNCFGLVDIDFDGFPELFHEAGSIMSYSVSFYSLKEENFCEKLFTTDTGIYFKMYGEHIGTSECSSEFYIMKTTGSKCIAVRCNRNAYTHGVYTIDSVIRETDTGWSFNEKFYKCKMNAHGNVEEEYHFRVNGEESDTNEYEQAYADYCNSLIPADFLHEEIIYYGNPDGETHFEYTINQIYDELYDLYDNYLKKTARESRETGSDFKTV